jgi:hypothetical protein
MKPKNVSTAPANAKGTALTRLLVDETSRCI